MAMAGSKDMPAWWPTKAKEASGTTVNPKGTQTNRHIEYVSGQTWRMLMKWVGTRDEESHEPETKD